MGRPAHSPTEDQRQRVRRYAASGVSQSRIAKALNISEPTLREHYRKELDESAGVWEADFESSLKRRALDPSQAPAIAIFVAKAVLGMREQVPLDPDKKKPEDMTLDEIRRRIADIARAEREAGDSPRVRKAS